MSESLIYGLIAVSVIACLIAMYFIKLHYGRIKQVKAEHAEQAEKINKRYNERRAYLIESIQVISKAVGNDEKLTTTEACIRLSTLLESLAPQLLQHSDYAVIHEVYKRTEHIPIKEQWKALSKQAKWSFQKEMAEIDEELGEQVKTAAAKLAYFDFDKSLH